MDGRADAIGGSSRDATPAASDSLAVPLDAIPVDPSMPDSAAEPVELTVCWRCHKVTSAADEFCPYCEARLRTRELNVERVVAENPENPYCSATIVIDKEAESLETEASRRAQTVTRMFWFYLGILAVGVAHGLLAHAATEVGPQNGNGERSQLALLVTAEIADTILVIFALFKIPRPGPQLRTEKQQIFGWLAGIPILAVLLLVNFGYHWLLREYLRLPDDLFVPRVGRKDFLVVLATICIQPAIVEELFFRYLALGALRSVAGVHGAVWLSSVMFGMAHIGVPLSIPILMIVGLGLGYARVLSGSIILPMAMHFAHNLVVSLLNGLT
jgi:membrane protease YdiL (CAAX protease family)